MVEEKGTYNTSDKLAIALTCSAGVMAIVLFLIEKTPLTAIVLLLLMAGLLVYPVLHFIKRSRIRGIVLICALVGTVVFGWCVWPKSKPYNIVDANPQTNTPQQATSPPQQSPPPKNGDTITTGNISQKGPCNALTIGSGQSTANCAPPSHLLSDKRLAIYKKEFPAEAFQGTVLIPAGTDQDIPSRAKQLCGVADASGHPWNCLEVGAAGISIQRPYDVKGNECYLGGGWETDIGRAFQKAWKDAGLTCKYIGSGYKAKNFTGGCCITIRTAILLGNAEK